MDLLCLQRSLASLEPAPNILDLEGRAVKKASVDIESAASPSVQQVRKPELASRRSPNYDRGPGQSKAMWEAPDHIV